MFYWFSVRHGFSNMKIMIGIGGLRYQNWYFPYINLITEHQRYRALPFSRKTFNVFSPFYAQKNRTTRCGLGLVYIYTIKNADAYASALTSGSAKGNRTLDFALRGRRLSRLTIAPFGSGTRTRTQTEWSRVTCATITPSRSSSSSWARSSEQ